MRVGALQLPPNPQSPTHLDHNDGTNILLRGTPENQSIPLDMHIAVSIRHDKHRRRISSALLLLALLGLATHRHPSRQTERGVHARRARSDSIPEFDFAEEGLGVRSFVGGEGGAGFLTIGFGDYGVAAGGEDEEVDNHGLIGWADWVGGEEVIAS